MVKRSTRKQNGGLPMPLSYLKEGYTEPSASAGLNMLVSQAGLARPVLNATGGRRKNTKKATRKHRASCKCKKGGFYPTVMGSFIRNASRLVPAAVYSGYKLMKSKSKTRKSKK